MVRIDLTAREHVPRWLGYATPVVTVLLALACGGIALLALGVSPLAAYWTMFGETLLSTFGRTQTLIKAVPLILAGLAVYLPLRAGLFNIGAEGQLVFGAVAGAWIGLNVDLPGVLLLPLMFVAAGAAGAFLAGIPAWLRARWDVNEIITSLLLTFVALQIQSYLVRGPMQDPTGNFPHTAQLSAAATIPEAIFNVHAGLVVAIAAVAVTYVGVRKTALGFEITFVGANDAAARQAGMSRVKIYLLVFVIGGAFAGLAGISEIAGLQGRLRAGFEPGYEFTAIPIALLGRSSAVNVMLAGLFFALLFVGGSSMSVAYGVPAALVEILQALIILFLITAEFFKRYQVDIEFDRAASASTGGEA